MKHYELGTWYTIEENRHQLGIITDKEFIDIQQRYINSLDLKDNDEINSLESEISDLEGQVEDLEDEKYELEKQVSDLEDEINKLKEAVKED